MSSSPESHFLAAWAEYPAGAPLIRLALDRARDPRQAIDLLERLQDLVPLSPYPARAVSGFERWASHLITPAAAFTALLEHPRLLDELLLLFAASPYLTDILVREPELYSVQAAPGPPPLPDEYPRMARELLRPGARPEIALAALRRFRRREMLRIAWQDLAGRLSLRGAVQRISALAEAVIEAALEIARAEVGTQFPTASGSVSLAVIGMGKLGGRELNYSSDVDLLFLYDSPDPRDHRQQLFARRLAERLISILGEQSVDGRLFRVDMRLRPEGSAGELVRSLGGYREYFDRWVETWERQALIKARPVAGDPALGEQFMALARRTAYSRGTDASLPEDVRDVKLLMESRAALSGPTLNVKEGRGTIRDVEFAVQLLQLIHGGAAEELRGEGTEAALTALRRREHLDREQAHTLRRGYRFFRAVEHRLQLLDDLPVRHLPQDPAEWRSLARLMGCRDAPEFGTAVTRTANAVRATCDSIYARVGTSQGDGEADLRPWILSLPSPEARTALSDRLTQLGFRDPTAALAAVERLAVASRHAAHPVATRRAFAELAPALFQACAASPDPDSALDAFQRLADRTVLYRPFYQRFLDESAALEDLCQLCGASPRLGALLVQRPEYLDVALTPAGTSPPLSLDDLAAELAQRWIGAGTHRQRLAQLRRFRTRHLVRLAARDLLTDADPMVLAGEWSRVAEVCLRFALDTAVQRAGQDGRWPRSDAAGFSILALGRLGAGELQFASDLDLLYLFEPRSLEARDYEQLAQALQEVLTQTTPEGTLFDVDLRLRPEGRQGFLVSSLESCQRYYRDRAQPWEMQAFLRARPVAGATDVAEALLAFLAPEVYPGDPPGSWTDDLRHMKQRIERERVSTADRDRNVKLGPGGLSDVEFLVQWLQRLHGGRHPALRTPDTAAALAALADLDLLPPTEVETISAGYRFLTRLRQRIWLTTLEERADLLPTDPRDLHRLARSLASEDAGCLEAEHQRVRSEIREVFLRHLG